MGSRHQLNSEQLAKALGGKRSGRDFVARCPAHDDANPSLSIADGADGEVLVFCHAGCAQVAVIAKLRERGLWPDRPNTPPRSRTRQLVTRAQAKTIEVDDQQAFALALFEQAQPAGGTLVENYLRSRGITVEIPDTLRFHPALKHTPSGLVLPAMIGLVTKGTENRPIGVHRTYLASDGTGKADVEPAKMMLGSAKGGAIRLAPAEHEVMLCEGIETGLSVLQVTGIPVWAALSTSGLKTIEVPI
jgi:putative DNA primase/helicase